ncbi:phosphopantetheine-binding protein [Streptomyces sp. NPDC059209]|uniref:phosphopantetheine-binding protein n=1 Tax=Streptomyces sp. NPDC059209 TaxID=3346769 RepID=UPI0036A0C685
MTDAEEEAVCQAVGTFLAQHDPALRPAPDDELFTSGLVNSLLVVELMVFLEGRYAIRFGVDDLDLGNFATLRRIARAVNEKQAAVRAGRG